MANHKSAEKRARQSLKRSARNSERKKSVKTFERKVVKALQDKSLDAESALREYSSRLMRAVAKGVLKKQTASRKLSRVSKRVSAAAKTA